MTDTNPYRAPSAPVADIVDPSEPPLASRSQRLGAAFIDGLVMLPITLPIAYALGLFSFSAKHSPTLTQSMVMSVISFIVFAVMQSYFLAKTGQTIGKKALGIRIVDLDGGLPPLGRLLGIRYGVVYLFNLIPILGSVLAVGDVLMIFRADKRCLHDVIAGTRVVQNSPA